MRYRHEYLKGANKFFMDGSLDKLRDDREEYKAELLMNGEEKLRNLYKDIQDYRRSQRLRIESYQEFRKKIIGDH